MTKRRSEERVAYEKGKKKTAKLLAEIAKLIQELPISEDGKAVIDWMTVSTQAEINCRLAELVSFLRNDEE